MMKVRRLTAGETAAARQIFADSIDYGRVKIYALPFLNQAVSPDGNIYFPAQSCPDDFSRAGEGYMIWLIHELTHVWQSQNGFRTWLGGMVLAVQGGYRRRRAYHCPPFGQTDFAALNMEQQAETAAECFAVLCCGRPPAGCGPEAYRQIAAMFAGAPASVMLPKYFCRIKNPDTSHG